MRNNSGVTLIELLVVIVIIGVLAAVAVPNFLSYRPESHLKSAARDLYSNLQLARVEAIKSNTTWAIEFNTGSNDYKVKKDFTGVNAEVKNVSLANYDFGVTYGCVNGATDINGGSFGSSITFAGSAALMYTRGTSNGGFVYLTNGANTSCYGVGARSSGVVFLRKWTGTQWTD